MAILPGCSKNMETKMFILKAIYFISLVYLVITAGWLCLLTLASWFHRARKNQSAPLMRMGVIVPAHNEELQIRKTIQDIQQTEYPAELLEIIVIADNCADRTAVEAAATGVTVIQRDVPDKKGKGQALDWFFSTCSSVYRHLDCIVFVDADAIPGKRMFHELSYSLADPEVRIVQGFNGVANPYQNWRTALNTAAFNVFNHLRMAGNDRLFGTSTLKGLGMAFETSVLMRYGWPAHSVVEDVELTLRLLEEGVRVRYNPDAVITSEMAESRQQADSQRRRWELGRFQLICQAVPRLAKKVLSGELRFISALMDLLMPPLALLVMLNVAGLVVSALFFPAHLVLQLGVMAIIVLYVCSAQLQRGAELKLWGYLMAAPLFILWKLTIYLSMLTRRKKIGWERTVRKAELK